MAKAKAKATKTEVKKVEEVKEIQTVKTDDESKTYKVRFESPFPKGVYRVPGIHYERLPNGDKQIVEDLEQPFEIGSGETRTVDQKTYDHLRKQGALLSPAEKAEQDRVRRKLAGRKSQREGFKKDVQTYSDEEMNQVFNDIPFGVE
jgi:hypothetical protein